MSEDLQSTESIRPAFSESQRFIFAVSGRAGSGRRNSFGEPRHDGAAPIHANDVERVLGDDVDAINCWVRLL